MKKIILLVIPLILFGCQKNNFKINEEITLKGDIDEVEIIEDGNYYQIQVLTLEEPIIIDGTEINKLEIDTDHLIEENEITGTLKEDSLSGLSYSIKVK